MIRRWKVSIALRFLQTSTDRHRTLANEEQIEAAGKVVKAFSRNSAFNPDFFPNPTLNHHYKVLLSVAFNDDVPDTIEDKTVPDYAMIEKRAGHLIEGWNDAVNADDRVKGSLAFASSSKSSPQKRTAAEFTHEDEPLVKKMHLDGNLGSMTVRRLKGICEHYRLPSHGLKAELVQRVNEHMNNLKVKSET